MDNIERFNRLTAYLFADLYLKFPVARQLPSDAIIQAAGECFPGDDTKEHYRFIGHTVLWLVDTGYFIRRGTGSSAEYVLSPKSFEVLNALPSSLAGKKATPDEKTLGEKLVEATHGVGADFVNETRKQAVAQIVGQVIGYAMRTVASPQ